MESKRLIVAAAVLGLTLGATGCGRDDDAMDTTGTDDGRDVLDSADDAGIEHRGADTGWVGIDEADDLDAVLMTA